MLSLLLRISVVVKILGNSAQKRCSKRQCGLRKFWKELSGFCSITAAKVIETGTNASSPNVRRRSDR